MKTYNNKYRGMNIHIEEINSDRVEYRVEKADKTVVEDSENYDVTVEQAMDAAKDFIDGLLDD
jgi:hypothetical protein